MINERSLRLLIREIITEAAAIDQRLLGNMGGNLVIALGPKAQEAMKQAGITDAEYQTIFSRVNNVSVKDFSKYDADFQANGTKYNVNPDILKAMAIEETTLGLRANNESGSTATGILQMTAPTLETFNKNLPSGVRYQAADLGNPKRSIQIVSHYLNSYLMKGKPLTDREIPILGTRYKTGSDAANYAARVQAFLKFVRLMKPK